MSYQQLIADQRLIQVSLERAITALAQSVIAKVALKTLDHTLHGRAACHDRLESFRHGGIVRVDMFQGIERNGDGSARLGSLIATAYA